MNWDVFPWIIEAIGIAILVIWTVIPIREFADIYRRLAATPPATNADADESEEVTA